MGENITLQRRSSKVDIQLSSFATFVLFKKHVESKFELQEGFVITDFDRETVIDDEVYKSMRSGDYWRRHPKANRLFLVLDDISAPLEEDVELEVSYQPHFNTITKTGHANFSKIPHAVAELIDNSIQATTDNTGPRTVEVQVELGGRGGSFLVVRDNGKGMNASDLKDFATYFLTQENRGVSGPQGSSTPPFVESQPNGSQSANGKGKGAPRKVPASFGKTKGRICSGFISKFGVGALQAGFYIGSCLTVITKTARLPDVCEFVMNEAEFERRAETNSTMFRDKITRRNPGKSKKGSPETEENGPEKELLDRLRAEEVGKSHFTYIVLTLRDQHLEWFTNHEKDSLKLELASIYHYYLHPENCPDGILRNDDEVSFTQREKEAAVETRQNGSGGGGSSLVAGAGDEAMDITYSRRSRPGQAAEVVRLGDITHDLESRLIAKRKDSFLFNMEVIHPMQDPRQDCNRLSVTGVIHYYPYDGEKETRPLVRPDEEDDESITIEAFWEGRLVPESHAAGLSFFPPHKLNKKEREALGSSWRRRIKGMLFFDWNFPISNNKLKLQFLEGDLHTALNVKYVLPSHPAVIYPGGRNIQKEFREWLVKCHETLDIEYRFDDKVPPQDAMHDKWRTMTFGKGGSTFRNGDRVKLPHMKPNVHGVIKFFRTEVDEDGEEGRGPAMFCLKRLPEDVFSDEASAAKLYPVTELDAEKSLMAQDDWDKAMAVYRKQMPSRTHVLMTASNRSLPKRLTIRTGKAESTKISVKICDSADKAMVQIPQGAPLRVVSILERVREDEEVERVLTFVAKPFTGNKYDKMYFFDPMNIKKPGEYTWTVAVAKDGPSVESKETWLLDVVCEITVLPGNPTKCSLDGSDWDVNVPLEDPCWLPAFAVKLRDASKCVCPMRSYKSVTVSSSDPGAFEITHVSSGSATHLMAMGKSTSDSAGPLRYDDHSWRLVPKQSALLSDVDYNTRSIEFEVKVVAHMQQDKEQDEDERVFTNKFDLTFQPSRPTELVMRSPSPSDGGPVITSDAGSGLPPFSLIAVDACGNRTAPAHNEAWQVSLEITAANMGAANEEGPEFSGPVREKIAGGAATFNDTVVKWQKLLKSEGELAVVEATLRVGTSNKDKKEVASTSFTIRIMPSKVPFRVVVCLDGKEWPAPQETERAPLADGVEARQHYPAGSVISGLHLRLYDQGGSELVVTKDTFDASNKETLACTWDPAWRWPVKSASKGVGYDRLPDLKVPTQLSRLNKGIHHAKVAVTPKAVGGWPVVPISATFAFAVHAGPVARWMAVEAGPGQNVTDNVPPIEITAGCDARACYESFRKVIKGFLPVDDYGNPVKNMSGAPEMKIERMPETKLLPEHQRKLVEPTKSNGVYQFPRNLNLDGPPGQSGHLVILSFSGEGANGSGSKEAARAGDGGGGAAGSQGGGSGADGTSSSVLRLAVSLKAGPPVKVLIRSPDLGVTEYSSEIRATQLAGFKVTDLDIKLVDRKGYPANISKGGVRVTVIPQEGASGGSHGASPRGGKKSAKRDLSKQATRDPEMTMPKFSLDQKIQGDQGAYSLSAAGALGGSSSTVKGAAQAKKVAERAARLARDGVALAVRAEANDLQIAGATIYWIRQRTAAVTKVNLAALAPQSAGGGTSTPTLEEPAMLSSVIGQRARTRGILRPLDGPLPSLVVWLDTDNGSPYQPPPDSISFKITPLAGPAGSRALSNLYADPVAAPESIGKPDAVVFHPKKDVTEFEQGVGEHTILGTYVERRALATQSSQGDEDERTVEMTLRLVAGAPFKFSPYADDANLFHSLSASNQEPMDASDDAARIARQLVDKTFRFAANDIRGNHAGQIKGPVRMRIENVDGVHVPTSEMPCLEDADGDGYVFADPTATGVFLFEENWLQAGVGSREGKYKLVVDSAGDPGLASWHTTFHFDTDEKRLNSIREIKARLKPLEDKIDRFKADRHAASTRHQWALEKAQEAVVRLPAACRAAIDLERGDYESSMAESEKMLGIFETEQNDRMRTQARPAKFEGPRMRPQEEEQVQAEGYVVNLGYVENEYRAKLLSMKAGTKMKAVYVNTKAQLDMVRKAGFGGFCRESVPVFLVPGGRRHRNGAEIASRQLPLRHLDDPGFVGYLVNMIQLPDEHEGLRDTLFSALFGSMVMFDSHDNAHAYQVRCKMSSKLSLPILVEEDGVSIERTGYTAPAKDPDAIHRLKAVFGAMQPHLTTEFKRARRSISLLKDNLIPALKDILQAESDMTGVDGNNDDQSWREEIETLTEELDELMARGTPAKTRGRGARGGGQTTRASGKRSSSSGGGGEATRGKGPKKRRGSEVAAPTPRSRSGKRTRR